MIDHYCFANTQLYIASSCVLEVLCYRGTSYIQKAGDVENFCWLIRSIERKCQINLWNIMVDCGA